MTAIMQKAAHNENSHRLDARGIAKLYAVSLVDIAKAIHANPDTLRKNSDSVNIQDELATLLYCFDRLYEVLANDENAVRRWLHYPNRGLDGDRPIALLKRGRLGDLKSVVAQMDMSGYA